jgi:hypothetical protein
VGAVVGTVVGTVVGPGLDPVFSTAEMMAVFPLDTSIVTE